MQRYLCFGLAVRDLLEVVDHEHDLALIRRQLGADFEHEIANQREQLLDVIARLLAEVADELQIDAQQRLEDRDLLDEVTADLASGGLEQATNLPPQQPACPVTSSLTYDSAHASRIRFSTCAIRSPPCTIDRSSCSCACSSGISGRDGSHAARTSRRPTAGAAGRAVTSARATARSARCTPAGSRVDRRRTARGHPARTQGCCRRSW